MTFPTDLEADKLHLFLFGPGFGESVVLRIPPDTWVVVDSCKVGARVPAADLLAASGAQWSAAFLTHPHEDHAAGLEAVLDQPSKPPRLVGFVDPRLDPIPETTGGHHLVRKRGVEAAFARIDSLPSDQYWSLRRGDRRTIGPAWITVLHPDLAELQTFSGSPNRLSSALLVEWEQTRILLGSDVETEDWETIGANFSNLSDHQILKIPHHASSNAVHPCYRPIALPALPTERVWLATPWSKGKRLPRFEDGEGVQQHLSSVTELHLTGLPVAFRHQLPAPARATRAQLLAGQGAHSHSFGPWQIQRVSETPKGKDQCVLRVDLASDGEITGLHHGQGTVVVTE